MGTEQRGIKERKKWDNCNSIINKICLKIYFSCDPSNFLSVFISRMMAEIMLIIVVNNESSPDTYRKISNITFRDQNKHRKKGKLQTAENAGRK